MILVIDNYDSFTYNLVQYIGTIDPDVVVLRNDRFDIGEIADLNPSHIVISPGPGWPQDAGLSVDVIQTYGEVIPILGVCLGHQCIAVAYGGNVVHSSEIVHGKTSAIRHNGSILFEGMKASFTATRYHSLVAEKNALPQELTVSADLENGIIMALEHETHPVFGVQFHPESIATEDGSRIIENFLAIKL